MPSSPDRAAGDRLPAPVVGAFLEGWRRALHAPALTAAMLFLTLAAAAPLAVVLDRTIEHDLGASAMSGDLRWNWNEGWTDEVRAEDTGVAATFTHEILGFGGTLASASRLVDGPIDRTLAGWVAAYVVL